MPELQDYEEDQAPPVDLGPEVPDFPPVPPPTPVQAPMAQPQVMAQPQGNPRDRLLPPPPPPRADGRTVVVPSAAEVAQQRRQRQEDAFIKGVYSQAQNFDQAMKDVSSARRMLGILKADREIKSGVPVDQAMYRNIQYFVQPGDKNFAPDFNAVRPTAPPSIQNFTIPGTTNQVPAFVTPGRTGTRVQPVPRAAMPQPEFRASVEEIAPGVRAAKLGPNHYQLLDRPAVQGSLDAVTKTQIELWKDDRKALNAQLKNESPDSEQAKAIHVQLDGLDQKIMSAARGGRRSSGMTTKPPKAAAANEASELIDRFPEKADAIRARYKATYGEDLEE